MSSLETTVPTLVLAFLIAWLNLSKVAVSAPLRTSFRRIFAAVFISVVFFYLAVSKAVFAPFFDVGSMFFRLRPSSLAISFSILATSPAA